MNIIFSGISGGIGGILSGYGIQYFREIQQRRRFSLLGASIIDYLTSQIDLGIGILEKISNGNITGELLPNSSWSGMGTIPHDVLLRIISLDDEHHKKNMKGFPPRDILTHCNNYFVYICENVNRRLLNSVSIKDSDLISRKDELISLSSQYKKDANNVKDMLYSINCLLKHNSQRVFPR